MDTWFVRHSSMQDSSVHVDNIDNNLRSTRCNLCSGDDAAAERLGKRRRRQVINLKILWTQETDAARREILLGQIANLLPGTHHLSLIVYTEHFILK